MTFYMIYGVKRHVPRQGGRMQQGIPCKIWSRFKQNMMTKMKSIFIFMLDISISLCWCAGFERGNKLCGSARGFFIISMTSMNFPKPGDKNSMTFPGLEKENEIPWLFQVFHDWIHPLTLTKPKCLWVRYFSRSP